MSVRTHPTWALTLILVLTACTPPTPAPPTAAATPTAIATVMATASPTVVATEAARPLAWPTATAFYETPEPGQALAVFESAVTI